MLPKPEHHLGFTEKQLKQILKDKNISMQEFSKAFGINTCCLDKEENVIFYVIDVERALFKLKDEDGCYHEWD